ncbi:DNA/RNA helicase domain-containing protein [Orenia marismortui]|uniref:8-oxo-dGTP diphosphatase n=1 Tax=Orenia marismortui TaxID=46469 RepID=A0A4R8H141_9FIRM|nr:DNA/RNA helicase domain-containing protein [Orenia marismortui]TDX53154.1 8-oxo-dGTP diphosphatase [Orenia marismortui]
MAFKWYSQSSNINCGGYGSIEDFLDSNLEEYLSALDAFVNSNLEFKVGDSQIDLWKKNYDFLSEQFKGLLQLDQNYSKLYIAFEYLFAKENARRADLVLFSKDRVIILDLKRKASYNYSDLERVIAYQRDLSNYHQQTIEDKLKLNSYLVLSQGIKNYGDQAGIKILNQSNFSSELSALNLVPVSEDYVERWLSSKYQASSNIIESIVKIFKEEKLAEIGSVKGREIRDTIDYLKQIIHYNEIKYKQKNLVFLRGVPGSGKTLAAIKLIHDYNTYKLRKDNNPLAAVYLSKNGSLISILEDKLAEIPGDLKSSLRSVYSYKREHMNNPKVPLENVLIFDDAQRAWDEKRMKSSDSEADVLLKTGHKIYRTKGSATIICLIGSGQAIHTGEEEGIELWQKALSKRGINNWNVYCSAEYEDLFKDAASLTVDQSLSLDYSIRSNLIDTSPWIEALLQGDLRSVSENLAKLYEEGLLLRITRDFQEAQDFVKKQETEHKNISYGLLISSKVRDKDVKYKINGGRYYGSFMKPEEVEEWFKGKNKHLNQGSSEFACQGLELDYPIVCFGGDYYYNGQEWEIEEEVRRYNASKYKDFSKIVENIYRVLLSRACKGMVIYIPELDRLDKTYEFLVESGLWEL